MSALLASQQVAHQVNTHLNSEVERLTLAVDALEQVRGTARASRVGRSNSQRWAIRCCMRGLPCRQTP